MTEQVRVNKSDIAELRRLANRLDDVERKLRFDRIGDTVGTIEAALSLLEEQQEQAGRVLGIKPGSAEEEQFRRDIEAVQGGVSGFDVGLQVAERNIAVQGLRKLPGGDLLATATELGIAGVFASAGARIGRTQEDRRRSIAEHAIEFENDSYRNRARTKEIKRQRAEQRQRITRDYASRRTSKALGRIR